MKARYFTVESALEAKSTPSARSATWVTAPSFSRGTIEDNIRLGKPGDLDAVLKAVEMDKEISSFPDGIHTMIGEGGLRLSGGQQARVALGRTLYHKRPLLILDDPFSAVDRKTEEEILTNIRPMLKDSIVILISHRLHFFKDFDRVVWFRRRECRGPSPRRTSQQEQGVPPPLEDAARPRGRRGR